MGKLLLWVALIALVWFAFRMVAISQRRRERSADGSHRTGEGSDAGGEGGPGRRGASREVPGEQIVPCAQCGLFLPSSDALHDGANTYCSRAHRDAHKQSLQAAGSASNESASRERASHERASHDRLDGDARDARDE